MSKYVFLFKEVNTDDRDCVKYIDISRLGKLECGHYFPKINLTGACFSMGLRLGEIDFNNIETVLTYEEFERLYNYNNEISDLGYGINEGDERYSKGLELYENIKDIINKLLSSENDYLFDRVIEDEKLFIEEEYSIDKNDIEYIFNNYGLSYQDRGIIGRIFDDIEEASYEEAEALGYVDKHNERYFDYEKFGDDLLEGEQYLELPSGRIAYLNY